jgi:TATA-box binding protein (TBP) (component of TFIID and TFIIIB)
MFFTKNDTLILEQKRSIGRRKHGGPVDLEELCQQPPLGGSIMYEPEQFPGTIYRMKSPSVAFLIFSVGKIVCGYKEGE